MLVSNKHILLLYPFERLTALGPILVDTFVSSLERNPVDKHAEELLKGGHLRYV